jgi:hypothetical protein
MERNKQKAKTQEGRKQRNAHTKTATTQYITKKKQR